MPVHCLNPETSPVGAPWEWMRCSVGRSSMGQQIHRPGPIIPGLSNVTIQSLIVSGYHTCVLTTESEVLCWGIGSVIGDGTTADAYTPSALVGGSPNASIQSLSGTTHGSCVHDAYNITTCSGSLANGAEPANGRRLNVPLGYRLRTPQRPRSRKEEVSIRVWSDALLEHERSSVSISAELPPGLVMNENWTITGTAGSTSRTNWSVTMQVGSAVFEVDLYLKVDIDTDGDGIPNLVDEDDDGDGFSDLIDACPVQAGNSTEDRVGCSDLDGDGVSDLTDAFPRDDSQQTDLDQDGYGDNADGTRPDDCPNEYGTSRYGNTYGCPDADLDGWANEDDALPYDSTQWSDADDDGYGDELFGLRGDACPDVAGNSTADRFGCPDADGDGYSDLNDGFPNDPNLHVDSDRDGVPDDDDASPTTSRNPRTETATGTATTETAVQVRTPSPMTQPSGQTSMETVLATTPTVNERTRSSPTRRSGQMKTATGTVTTRPDVGPTCSRLMPPSGWIKTATGTATI